MSNRAEAHATDEAALIEQAQAGDLRAFDQLVLRHQQEVFAVALRMLGDRDEAQDVAQDAFVRAYRAIGAFRREARLSTWLVSITMNLCRNRRRWWARRRRVIAASLDEPDEVSGEPKAAQVADPAASPQEVAQRREQQRQILAGLQQLREGERVVIILRDLEGYSYEEIARMLGCEIGTVKSKLSRARTALRAQLDGMLP